MPTQKALRCKTQDLLVKLCKAERIQMYQRDEKSHQVQVNAGSKNAVTASFINSNTYPRKRIKWFQRVLSKMFR